MAAGRSQIQAAAAAMANRAAAAIAKTRPFPDGGGALSRSIRSCWSNADLSFMNQGDVENRPQSDHEDDGINPRLM